MRLFGRFADGDKNTVAAHETAPDYRVCELLKAGEDSFNPYFTTRVMARVQATVAEQEAWAAYLWKIFRRVAVTATLIVGILAVHNIAVQWEYRTDANAVEMILGIPPATLATTIQLVGLWL